MLIRLLRTICMAFAAYSRIPVPQVKWEERNAAYVICFYPLVGIAVGAAEAAVLWGAGRFAFPTPAAALLLLALPVLFSGGIHLDGLVDTADARHSFLPPEEKQRILKDPHVGAFGVIRLLLYLMLVLAGLLLLLEKEESRQILYVYAFGIPVWSRICAAFAAVLLPKAKKEGMLHAVTAGAQKKQIALLLPPGVLTFAGLCISGPVRAAALLAADLLLFLYFRRMVRKEFGGMSGDLAGWFLCMAEGAGIFVLVLVSLVMC
ncbi:MAG: adenosylcobinamide-GDP ribazoletransferase [Lachnospiraceae bacterium]|nr:adenosylcobinamide-GDP ribazoletransferase [Lachnospiraceae bacterium]